MTFIRADYERLMDIVMYLLEPLALLPLFLMLNTHCRQKLLLSLVDLDTEDL